MLCLYRSTIQAILLFIREAIDCHALILYGFPPLGLERNFAGTFNCTQSTGIKLLDE